MANKDDEAAAKRAREQLAEQERQRKILAEQAAKRAREQLAREQAAREADERQRARDEQRRKDGK